MNRFAIICLSVVFLAPLSGCFVFTPSPYVEGVQLVTTAASGIVSLVPNTPQNTLVHRHRPVRNVCIEFNKGVPIDDFVPALQAELMQRGIENRVYSEGMAPMSCDAILNYSARVEWEERGYFKPEYSPYLAFVAISLQKDGAVLASSQYRLGRLGYDKWASTGRKIGWLLDDVLATPF